MKLIGHSLGGYLSVAYTLRHPTRVSRLVLVSPAGVGPSPDSAPGGTADPDRKLAATDSTFAAKNSDYVSVESRGNPDADAASCHSLDVGDDVEQEIHDPQANMVPATDGQAEQDLKEIDAEVKDASNSNGSSTQLPSTAPKVAEAKKTDSKPKQGPRWGPRTRSALGWLWEQNVSPFGILRTSSFLGPLLMSRYTQRRFGALPEEELKALSAYCQGVFLSKGSGEYCLAHILLPGAWARYPLLHRVAALPNTLPVALAYGESDWMSVSSGREVVKELARNGNDKGRCFVVPHAGHHLYLDNPRAFDRLMEKILDGEADRPAERA
jgi:cardiolipin-specific phospholipase